MLVAGGVLNELDIYLAGAYRRREELLSCRRDLEAIGHTVTSRWVLGLHEAQEGVVAEWRQFGQEDLDDLRLARWICLFTEPLFAPFDGTIDYPYLTSGELNALKRGGRHTEFGYAMARGMQLLIVGPRENVFHHDPTVFQRDTWPQMLDWIKTVWTPDPGVTLYHYNPMEEADSA